MEQVAGNTAKSFWNNMVTDLKTFKLGIWAKYLSMITCIFVLINGITFKQGWWSILIIIFGLFMCCMEIIQCFFCIPQSKIIKEKLEPYQKPTIKGSVYFVFGILMIFWGSILWGIVVAVCGLFFLLGSVFDKKTDAAKAPMV